MMNVCYNNMIMIMILIFDLDNFINKFILQIHIHTYNIQSFACRGGKTSLI